MKQLTLLILLTVLTTSLVAPLSAGDASHSRVLSAEEMGDAIAGACDKAAGIMTSVAFASGFLFAVNPPLSVTLLAAAGGIGVGIVALC